MTLPLHVEQAILAHARRAMPDECCGLLVGAGDALVAAMPTANAADDPTRGYLIDPVEHFRVIRGLRGQALDVVGAYHSHPRSSAHPSETDAAHACGDFVFLIVGLGTEPPEIAAWRWADGNFTAVPLVRPV